MTLTLLGIIVGPLITLLIAIITLLYNKNSQLERQLDSEKRRIFEDFITTLLKTVDDSDETDEKVKKKNHDELIGKMKELKKDLILYGSSRSIRAHNAWILESKEGDTKTSFRNMERFIRSLRKEIGLPNKFYFSEYEVLQVVVRENLAKTLRRGGQDVPKPTLSNEQ